ncbi:hypothetical protein AVEN_254077-1 [Araneus ventricosus]|uniref:Uncharacterized protein n=1 Tax=Araneus ventricosus TaxID=182803 RepID=A0A4Y2BXY2_ARAVE|nr:hypothetical protein AVEN_254077-1 [Araneus ventricosus]
MATGNMSKHGIMGASTNQDSYLVSASCRIFQDLADIYINPEESISVDAEAARLENDLNSETPNKYPNAPHSSPIDLQNDPDSSVFNEELVKCLKELPVILLSLEERTKDGSAEMLEVDTEDPPRSYFEASTSTKSDVKPYGCKGFQYHNENFGKNCSVKAMTVTASGHHAGDSKSESTEPFYTNVNNQLERFNFLRVDSVGEFNADFYGRSTLSDNTSIIANCASDASDISLEDVESVSSDDNSSCESTGRIEFEALALDSTIHPSTVQRFQHWRIRGRNKRALSLDEMNPSKILHTTDFSTTPFELTI